MLSLEALDIGAWVGSYLWPFFRVASFFMAMPIIGSKNVPARVRLVLAFFTSLAIAPLIGDVPSVDSLSYQSILVVLQQIFVGTLLGFFLQLFFQIFIIAGQMISMQSGLAMAMMNDPINGTSVPVIGQIYMIFTTLVFVTIDGHLVVLEVLVESFRVMPISTDAFGLLGRIDIAAWGAWMFMAGFAIALPPIFAILVVNFSFGFISRAAPQMNIFSLGFPVTMILGLIIFWFSISSFLPMFNRHLQDAMLMLNQIVYP